MLESKESSNSTTLNYIKFNQCLKNIFSEKPPAEQLVKAMFQRFRPQIVKPDGGFDSHRDTDILDFLIGINLLSRNTQDKKIKLLFQLCDDDDDGCMTPVQILMMLQKVERIFCRETRRIDLNTQILLN